MKASKDLLSSIIKSTQVKQYSIYGIMKSPLSSSLRAALKSQLEEYDSIEDEALRIANLRGWNLENVCSPLLGLLRVAAKIRLCFGDPDYTAASLTIQCSTKGVIKGLHSLRQFHYGDERISSLAQKLIDCEIANIRQMQGFL